MEKTKYTGVFFRVDKKGMKTFYIKYLKNRKQTLEKVGTSTEGITAVYASKIRAKKTSIDRLKDDAPFATYEENNLKFDEAFNLYYDYAKYNNKDHEITKQRYDKHLKDEIGHIELVRIDDKLIENLKKKLINKINTNTKQPYAAATINHFLDLIRGVFNHIIKEKNLSLTNPASGNRVKRLKIDNKRERYLETEDIKILFEEVEKEFTQKFKHIDTIDKIKTFMMLSFSTGARLGSVCTIRKQDINFTQKTITIKNHKKGSTYTGYLHPQYEEYIYNRCMELNRMDYLVSGSSEVYQQPTINKHLKPILDRLFNQGIDSNDLKNRVVVHTFRHTFASLLAINGTPLYTIMKLMDHEDISQTIRYAKLSPDNGSKNVFGLGL